MTNDKAEKKLKTWGKRLSRLIEAETGVEMPKVTVRVRNLRYPTDLATCNPFESRININKSTIKLPPEIAMVVLMYHLLTIARHWHPYGVKWRREIPRLLGMSTIHGLDKNTKPPDCVLTRYLNDYRAKAA